MLMRINRVVEVFGVLAVDSHEGHIAQVFAPCEIRFVNLFYEARRLLVYRRRPLVGNIVAAQRHIDLESRRAAVPQHLGNTGDRLATTRGILNDLRHHELAIFGASRLLIGNQNFLCNALAVWHHNAKTLLVVIAANDLREAALQNFDYRAFFAAAIVHTRNSGQHLVAIEQRFHFPRA